MPTFSYSHWIPASTWASNSWLLHCAPLMFSRCSKTLLIRKMREISGEPFEDDSHQICPHWQWLAALTSSRTVSLATRLVSQQVPGETSPAVSWVFPLSALSLVRNVCSVSDVPAPHSSSPQEPRAPLPTLAEKVNHQQVLVYVLLAQLFTFTAHVLQEQSFVTLGFLSFLSEVHVTWTFYENGEQILTFTLLREENKTKLDLNWFNLDK